MSAYPLIPSHRLDASVLSPSRLTRGRYSGSLSTPPCTENVTWLISSEILSVSEIGFENIRDVIGFNSRFPQNALGEPNVLQLALSSVPAQDVADLEEGDDAVPEEEDDTP